MPSYLKGDVVLVRYPFSDLSGTKVRPAVKRGLYTIQQQLCLKTVGHLTQKDMERLDRSLRQWLGLYIFVTLPALNRIVRP